MAERDYAPLSSACVRGLCDKFYDKRKFAGVEIEKYVGLRHYNSFLIIFPHFKLFDNDRHCTFCFAEW